MEKKSNTVKKTITIVAMLMIILTVLPASESVSDDRSQGVFRTYTVSLATFGIGVGCRTGRFETGVVLSSTAMPFGLTGLAIGHPLSGFVAGAVLYGGVDSYVRWDLIRSEKWGLSVGPGISGMFSMLGSLDLSAVLGLSIRNSVTTENDTTLFVECLFPMAGLEYSQTSPPEPDTSDSSEGPSNWKEVLDEKLEYGFLKGVPMGARIFNGGMTARLGVELFF